MKCTDSNNERYFSSAHERRLIRAAQGGDKEASNQLVMAALPFAQKNVGSLFRDLSPEDHDDLMQETVTTLYDCIERYDLGHPARARLYVFASKFLRATAARYLQRNRRLTFSPDAPDMADETDIEKSVFALQIEAIVRAILATMSIRDQDLLLSRHARDQKSTRAEMAERYDCPPHVIEYAEKRAQEHFERTFEASGAAPSAV